MIKSFSLKTWFRSTCRSSLALLNIEREECDNLDIESVIDEFASRKNRRLKFM